MAGKRSSDIREVKNYVCAMQQKVNFFAICLQPFVLQMGKFVSALNKRSFAIFLWDYIVYRKSEKDRKAFFP